MQGPFPTFKPAVSEKRDYYSVLGVARDVEAGDLKRAYRKLAVQYHPDRNPGDHTAEANFKEAAEAYEVLSDAEKRALYDRYGHEGLQRGGFGGFRDASDVFSAFSDIFGDLFGGGGRSSAGADIEAEVELTLPEAATGATKEVVYRRRAVCTECGGSGAEKGTAAETCPQCRGRGQVVHQQGFLMITSTCQRCGGEGRVVRHPCHLCEGSGMVLVEDRLQVSIPAGVEDGSTLRIGGRGEVSPRGGRPGNLYVAIRVEADPRFERDGADLHTEVLISFAQAALGAEVQVPTLSGDQALDVPRGTQPGDTIVLRGKGLPHLRQRGQGDLVVHLRVVVPTELSAEQEQRLRAYAEVAGGAPATPPKKKGLFNRRKR
jgi:molecular chaperone DnaJ